MDQPQCITMVEKTPQDVRVASKKRIQQMWIPHVAQVRQAEFDQFDQKRQHLGRSKLLFTVVNIKDYIYK